MKPDTEAVIVSFFAELVSEKTDEISTLYDEIKKINRKKTFLKELKIVCLY